jgi:hypothetical protein
MSQNAGGKGCRIAVIGPECAIDFVNAVIVDENAHLVELLVKIRNLGQFQHGNDVLHVSIGLQSHPPFLPSIHAKPDDSSDHGETGNCPKNASEGSAFSESHGVISSFAHCATAT